MGGYDTQDSKTKTNSRENSAGNWFGVVGGSIDRTNQHEGTKSRAPRLTAVETWKRRPISGGSKDKSSCTTQSLILYNSRASYTPNKSLTSSSRTGEQD